MKHREYRNGAIVLFIVAAGLYILAAMALLFAVLSMQNLSLFILQPHLAESILEEEASQAQLLMKALQWLITTEELSFPSAAVVFSAVGKFSDIANALMVAVVATVFGNMALAGGLICFALYF